MKIGLLGSTGFIGRTILTHIVNSDIDVKVMVRDRSKLKDFEGKIEIFEGSLQSLEDLNKFSYECDVIINALGGLKGSNQYELFKEITSNIVSTIELNHVKKLISINGSASILPGEKVDFQRRMIRFIVRLINRPGVDSKDAEMEVLFKNKQIKWVSVRVSGIKKGGGLGGEILADDKKLPGITVNQEDIAKFMVDQIATDKWMHKAPYIATK